MDLQGNYTIRKVCFWWIFLPICKTIEYFPQMLFYVWHPSGPNQNICPPRGHMLDIPQEHDSFVFCIPLGIFGSHCTSGIPAGWVGGSFCHWGALRWVFSLFCLFHSHQPLEILGWGFPKPFEYIHAQIPQKTRPNAPQNAPNSSHPPSSPSHSRDTPCSSFGLKTCQILFPMK